MHESRLVEDRETALITPDGGRIQRRETPLPLAHPHEHAIDTHVAPSAPPPWWETPKGLYNVSADPREQHDLQAAMPDVVAKLRQRLLEWNQTTAPTIHLPADPNGTAQANRTDCWSPWR
jgi:hypothetical protein